MAFVASLLFASRTKAIAPQSAVLSFMLCTAPSSEKMALTSSSVIQPGNPLTYRLSDTAGLSPFPWYFTSIGFRAEDCCPSGSCCLLTSPLEVLLLPRTLAYFTWRGASSVSSGVQPCFLRTAGAVASTSAPSRRNATRIRCSAPSSRSCSVWTKRIRSLRAIFKSLDDFRLRRDRSILSIASMCFCSSSSGPRTACSACFASFSHMLFSPSVEAAPPPCGEITCPANCNPSFIVLSCLPSKRNTSWISAWSLAMATSVSVPSSSTGPNDLNIRLSVRIALISP
mmetsp:Transcript_99571/g.197363  ORF Transcript_99571/g.197363 Transcript_99571/m.197363 type:complete len:284 (-) Transcript_99571:261-1112(-)